VGVGSGRSQCFVDCIINNKLPGNKDSNSKSCEEFENGVVINSFANGLFNETDPTAVQDSISIDIKSFFISIFLSQSQPGQQLSGPFIEQEQASPRFLFAKHNNHSIESVDNIELIKGCTYTVNYKSIHDFFFENKEPDWHSSNNSITRLLTSCRQTFR